MQLIVCLSLWNPSFSSVYYLEGDGELAFVAYEFVETQMKKFEAFLKGCAPDEADAPFPDMPEVQRLAAEAVAWAKSAEGVEELVTLRQEKEAADAAVAAGPQQVAVRARRARNGMGADVQQRVDTQASIERQAEKDRLQAVADLKDAALRAKLAALPPQDEKGFQDYVIENVKPALQYFRQRWLSLNPRDYGSARILFRAISVFHPKTLAKLSLEDAESRLRELAMHPKFARDDHGSDHPLVQNLIGELNTAHRLVGH